METFSLISQVALAMSIPISIGLFLFMNPQRAALIVIFGGDMFLPELVNFKFPFMPPLDKHNLPYICVLIGCLLRRRARLLTFARERWFTVLTALLIVGAALTGLTNMDQIVVRKGFPMVVGLDLKDGLYLAMLNLTWISLPFFLGLALFRSPENCRRLLAGFAIATVLYLPFALFEIRLSPILHFSVYGFGQHDYFQTLRLGGFRPMAFMANGLALTRFFMVAIYACFILGRTRRLILGVRASWVGLGILVVLVLCKSMGALAFAVVAIPLLLWTGPKLQLRIAFVLALIVFLYPVLRAAALLPTDEILQAATSLFGDERAGSLGFRFRNENMLLEKARQRIVFGWGQYGRNFVYDNLTGMAVADGYWVIQIGLMGAFGFIASFAPMLVPIFLARKRMKLIFSDPDRRLVTGMALIVGVVALDWVPNGLFSPYPYLFAGALTGVSRELTTGGSAAIAEEEPIYEEPFYRERDILERP